MRKPAVFLFLLVCLSSLARAVSPEITAQPGQVNPYKTRSELLMDAANYTGVFSPEQAAAVWAQGVRDRSAALQYTVMTDGLKKEYAGQLDALRSNWVTGGSSPWVENFTIQQVNKPDALHTQISLRFKTISSYGPPEFYDAKLWLVHEGEFWRIERIQTDKGLYLYTFYQP